MDDGQATPRDGDARAQDPDEGPVIDPDDKPGTEPGTDPGTEPAPDFEDGFDLETQVDPAEKLLARERFTQARFDVGYERGPVDALVAELRESYAEKGTIEGVIESHTLRTAGFRDGYEVTEVENWLRDLVEITGTELGERPPPIATSTGPQSSEAIKAAKRARAQAQAQAQAQASAPSVITEKKSFFERMRRNR